MSDDSKVQKTSISLSQELYDWANDQVKNKTYHDLYAKPYIYCIGIIFYAETKNQHPFR